MVKRFIRNKVCHYNWDRFGIAGISFILMSGSLGYIALLIGGFTFGIGYSTSTLLPPFLIDVVFGNRDYASIYSIIMTASTLGIALGTTMFGFVFDITGSYYAVFIVVLVLQVLAILIGIVTIGRKVKSYNLSLANSK